MKKRRRTLVLPHKIHSYSKDDERVWEGTQSKIFTGVIRISFLKHCLLQHLPVVPRLKICIHNVETPQLYLKAWSFLTMYVRR
jgi:hypothetical protein